MSSETTPDAGASNVIPLSRAQRRKAERDATKQQVETGLHLYEPMEALSHAVELVLACKQNSGKPGIYAVAAEDGLGNVSQEGVVLVCTGPMMEIMVGQMLAVMTAMGVTETWPPQEGLTAQLTAELEEREKAKSAIVVTNEMPSTWPKSGRHG